MAAGQMRAHVYGLTVKPSSGSPFLVLQVENGLWLEVEIGPGEASILLLHQEGISPVLPLTHELLEKALEVGGVQVTGLEIYAWEEGGPLCRLQLKQKGSGLKPWAVRPSDGFILALRMGFPIWLERGILNRGLPLVPLCGPPEEGFISLEPEVQPAHH